MVTTHLFSLQCVVWSVIMEQQTQHVHLASVQLATLAVCVVCNSMAVSPIRVWTMGHAQGPVKGDSLAAAYLDILVASVRPTSMMSVSQIHARTVAHVQARLLDSVVSVLRDMGEQTVLQMSMNVIHQLHVWMEADAQISLEDSHVTVTQDLQVLYNELFDHYTVLSKWFTFQ